MKIFITLALSLFCINTYASTKGYELDLHITNQQGNISNTKVLVQEGKTGTFVQKSLGNMYIEVLADEGELQGSEGILMKFKIGKMNPDGSTVIDHKPILLSKEGEESSILIGDNPKHPKVGIKVVAKRKIFDL